MDIRQKIQKDKQTKSQNEYLIEKNISEEPKRKLKIFQNTQKYKWKNSYAIKQTTKTQAQM